MQTLGFKIKKVREIFGVKQDRLAELIGISQSTYSKMEKDEVEISKERLEQIANALGVSVQDIISFDEKMFFNIKDNQSSANNSANGGYVVYNNISLSDNERKLYEDKIKLLEEKNEDLKKEIERLRL